jgi:3-deoxy-D-manno-octulosonate 8-phosphate phosphatase (KDO 8-P phosphatase)
LIELLVLDVDGCLTDGKIVYSSDGREIKSFNVKDGLAISTWIQMGKHVAIITGRESTIVEKRAKELKIQYLFQGVKNKLAILDDLISSLGLTYSEVAAIGDDLNDYKMLQKVALSFTPKDGVDDIIDIVDITLKSSGGDGAVREMIDCIIDKYDLKESFLQNWL